MSFGTLIDPATLVGRLGEPGWCIIDVRHQLSDTAFGERAYAEGHIPGAYFLHCDRDLSGPANGSNGRHPLPDPAVLAECLGGLGITESTQVVVYDDAQGMIAGRLWWLLRWLGHDRVAVLDGGWQAWLAAGGTISTELPVRQPAVFKPKLRDMAVDAAFVSQHLDDAALLLIDGRAPDRFRGENETLDPVGGHIPGAVNHFFRDNLDERGCFKDAATLRAAWLARLGACPASSVVLYCGSGVSACHNLLAMEIAGLPGARLYGGSWSEWCANPARPVAT